jgi:NTP pyrophosphatase (non-canonical NTP hydrolase)
MDLRELTKKALELRSEYAKFEKRKYGHEWTTSNIMQGFVGDVGDLMKLVMAKEGIRSIENLDEKISHELVDCLWSILVLAKKYDVDIEKEFLLKMNDLKNRIVID